MSRGGDVQLSFRLKRDFHGWRVEVGGESGLSEKIQQQQGTKKNTSEIKVGNKENVFFCAINIVY